MNVASQIRTTLGLRLGLGVVTHRFRVEYKGADIGLVYSIYTIEWVRVTVREGVGCFLKSSQPAHG